MFSCVPATRLRPGAAIRCIGLSGERILVCDTLNDSFSVTIIKAKCLAIRLSV